MKNIPFRNNPEVTANWTFEEPGRRNADGTLSKPMHSRLIRRKETKKAYYDISVKDDKLHLQFREEKKRLGGSQEKEEHWFSYLEFALDSSIARDLKMFINNYVKGKTEEEKDTIHLYMSAGEVPFWTAQKDSLKGYGKTKENALEDLLCLMRGRKKNIFGKIVRFVKKYIPSDETTKTHN